MGESLPDLVLSFPARLHKPDHQDETMCSSGITA